MIRTSISAAATFVAALVSMQPAQALEAFKTYDNFSASAINSSIWLDGERTLGISRGVLTIGQRGWGTTLSDTGTTHTQFDEHFPNPDAITEMRAKITVNSIAVNACGGNTSVTQSRARIITALFNTGTPTPGSELNDALVQVRFTRFSNSADPAGVLQIQGLLSICTASDCSTSSTVGNIVSLGTVPVGTPATVQFQWDKPSKTITFMRDSGAFSGSVAYAQSDVSPPAEAYAALSTRVELASCLSSAPIEGAVNASFDSIAVNKSAAP